ncbi:MAG: ATP-binding cassette domain-containing protein [Planctomycetes bacterium]|nr:ATP-binding cassette domain-containing protein [Planctomycetota bacterium]
MSDGTIRARGLCKRFGAKVALEPCDLDVEAGRVTGLLGPNGSGKSTLMRLLVGLVRPDAGGASVAGVALEGDGLAVRRRCAYAPGEIGLYGELRGDEHLDWFLRGRERESRARARALAESFELPLRRRVHTYSHGMKRQLMFAAALAPRVPVRILDEPSEGLDPQKRSTMIQLLQEDAARGTTVLLSSHHLGEVDRVCTSYVFLSGGRKISTERTEDVARRARRLVRATFGSEVRLAELAARLRTARASVRGELLVAELDSDDPRPFLAELATLEGFGAPRTLEYGQVSLSELYRGLYGVEEAC